MIGSLMRLSKSIKILNQMRYEYSTFWIGKVIDAWMQLRLRPLHCACKSGNIFGVEWLITHGADINVEDRV